MERFSRENTVADETSVRDRMRARAREQTKGERGPFRTPEWLDHSFVLPVDQRTTSVPAPREGAPAAAPVPVFERPATPEVDFAAVVRRADTSRRARLATAAGLLMALAAMVVFQLTGHPAAAACAILFALVSVGATTLRVVLNRTPVPYISSS